MKPRYLLSATAAFTLLGLNILNPRLATGVPEPCQYYARAEYDEKSIPGQLQMLFPPWSDQLVRANDFADVDSMKFDPTKFAYFGPLFDKRDEPCIGMLPGDPPPCYRWVPPSELRSKGLGAVISPSPLGGSEHRPVLAPFPANQFYAWMELCRLVSGGGWVRYHITKHKIVPVNWEQIANNPALKACRIEPGSWVVPLDGALELVTGEIGGVSFPVAAEMPPGSRPDAPKKKTVDKECWRVSVALYLPSAGLARSPSYTSEAVKQGLYLNQKLLLCIWDRSGPRTKRGARGGTPDTVAEYLEFFGYVPQDASALIVVSKATIGSYPSFCKDVAYMYYVKAGDVLLLPGRYCLRFRKLQPHRSFGDPAKCPEFSGYIGWAEFEGRLIPLDELLEADPTVRLVRPTPIIIVRL